MLRPPVPNWLKPGEPHASLYTPEWDNGMFLIGAIDEPEQSHFRAFFAHLDKGWQIIRPLQLAVQALIFSHSPMDDVSHWVDVEITDNYRWLAHGCLQMIPVLEVVPDFLNPIPRTRPEPPVDDLEPEARALGRNMRLLAMMEGSGNFPAALRGMVGPAASALTAWERELPDLSDPVVQHVVNRDRVGV